jgi:hypothetical protein
LQCLSRNAGNSEKWGIRKRIVKFIKSMLQRPGRQERTTARVDTKTQSLTNAVATASAVTAANAASGLIPYIKHIRGDDVRMPYIQHVHDLCADIIQLFKTGAAVSSNCSQIVQWALQVQVRYSIELSLRAMLPLKLHHAHALDLFSLNSMYVRCS